MPESNCTEISIEYLRECLIPNAAVPSGLQWRTRPREHFVYEKTAASWNLKWPGKQAGTLTSKGYFQIHLNHPNGPRRRLYNHRIIFALAHGRWPTAQLDHRNRDRGGNRLENLREATQAENNQNLVSLRNTSGFPGVCFDKQRHKWRACIRIVGRTRHLGYFATPEAAAAAYRAAKLLLHSFQPVLPEMAGGTPTPLE